MELEKKVSSGGLGKQRCTFSPRVRETILGHLEQGMPKGQASILAGASQQQIFDWIAQGKKDPERYPDHYQFGVDVDLAIARAQEKMVDVIRETALSRLPNTWQAAAWYLERTAPEEFGKRDHVKLSNEGAPIIQLNQVVLSDAGTREIGRDLLRRVTGSVVQSVIEAREEPEELDVIDG